MQPAASHEVAGLFLESERSRQGDRWLAAGVPFAARSGHVRELGAAEEGAKEWQIPLAGSPPDRRPLWLANGNPRARRLASHSVRAARKQELTASLRRLAARRMQLRLRWLGAARFWAAVRRKAHRGFVCGSS